MLTDLNIQNFQKHRQLNLEFGPYLNIITGSSSRGKSAIIKSIKWLYLNKPLGLTFKNYKTKKPVIVDDGKLKHFKSSSKHYYEFSGKQFTKFGNEVPYEIKEHYKISDLNFIDQFTSYSQFLGLSKLEKTNLLYSLVGLDDIRLSIGTLKSDINDKKKELKILQTQKEEIEKELTPLKFIEPSVAILESDITELEKLDQQLKNLSTLKLWQSKLHRIPERIDSKIIDEFKILESKIRIVEQILKVKIPKVPMRLGCDELTKCNVLIEIVEQIIELQNQLKSIPSKIEGINELKELENKIRIVKQILKIKKINVPKKLLVDPLTRCERMLILLGSIIKKQKQIDKLNKELQKQKISLEKIKKDIRICPLCKQKMVT